MNVTTNQYSLNLENSKIIAPSIIAILLFAFAVFGVALPTLQENLVEQKKKTITVLTQTTWNILAHYESQVSLGYLDREKAQRLAKEQISELRYGSNGKDYFWINDTHPRMIMHPYLPELEKQDLSNYTDKTGKLVFMEIIKDVTKSEGSFIPYFWQWNDSQDRVSPKLSFVKLFRPWGWVIGTGLYIDDVTNEITVISRRFLLFSIIILAIVASILALIIRKNLKEMVKRQLAEKELANHQENLEKLVAKRTDELRTANKVLDKDRQQLQKALSEIKVLRGILPICSFCKNIRNDEGYYEQIEGYIHKHSGVDFSHTICPPCVKKHYPKEYDKLILKKSSLVLHKN